MLKIGLHFSALNLPGADVKMKPTYTIFYVLFMKILAYREKFVIGVIYFLNVAKGWSRNTIQPVFINSNQSIACVLSVIRCLESKYLKLE